MRVILTVSGPVPNWASASHRSSVTRPSPTHFQRFMTAVGRHYAGQVAAWSIWNEPNHPDFSGRSTSTASPSRPSSTARSSRPPTAGSGPPGAAATR